MEGIFQCSREKCCQTAFIPKTVQNALITQTCFQPFTGENVTKRNSFLFLGKRHEKLMLYESVSHLCHCISKLKCIHSIDLDGLLFHSNGIFLAFIFVYCVDLLKIFLFYIRQICHFISSDASICFQVLLIQRLNMSHISFS